MRSRGFGAAPISDCGEAVEPDDLHARNPVNALA